MKRLGAIAIVVAIAAALSAGIVGNSWTTTIPADAATTILARTSQDPDISPIRTATGEVTADVAVGNACLDRVTKRAGGLDLCWAVIRVSDADPVKDYYRVRVWGTAFGDLGTGMRWAVVRTRLDGQPMDGAFDAWPIGQYDGPCTEQTVGLSGIATDQGMDPICGRTIARSDASDWSQRLEWYCVGCVLPGKQAIGLAVDEVVGVGQGTVPAWDIFGDLGD